MDKNNKVYTVIFTFTTSFIFIFLLSFVYFMTKERINKNEALFERKAVLSALGIDYSSDQEAFTKFETSVKRIRLKDQEKKVFSTGSGDTIGYAAVFSGSGLWGTITGVLGVDSAITKTTGLSIISHSETPGLGGRIDQQWFQRQFRNEVIKDGGITVDTSSQGTGNYNPADGQVDGITGATRTSESMEKLIFEAVKFLEKLKQEGSL